MITTSIRSAIILRNPKVVFDQPVSVNRMLSSSTIASIDKSNLTHLPQSHYHRFNISSQDQAQDQDLTLLDSLESRSEAYPNKQSMSLSTSSSSEPVDPSITSLVPSRLQANQSKSQPSTSSKRAKKVARRRDPLDSLLNSMTTDRPATHNRRTRSSSALDATEMGEHRDPVSTILSTLDRPNDTIFSSAEAMDQAILKCIHPFDQTSPILPISQHSQHSRPKSDFAHVNSRRPNSTGLPASTQQAHHQLFGQQLAQWSQIYIRYLKSSTNPEEFSKRIKDLVSKRLPKKLIEEVTRFHSSEQDLVSVGSYNQLIGHFYRSERYDQARRLMKEMEERGISKNQETQELIACSYQALNKFEGVRLALGAIEADGRRISDQCLTRLFSIRPRKSSKLEHFDRMDQLPIAASTKTSNLDREKKLSADQSAWMSIEDFLNSKNGNPEPLMKDGRAIVTLAKRLMETDRWREACELVDMILELDVSRSAAENSRLAISPYWATSLLDALVFGMYNAKQKSNRLAESMDSLGIIPTDKSSSSTHSSRGSSGSDRLDRKAQKNKKQENGNHQHSDDLPADRIFDFVEKFIDRHRSHRIKTNHRILLNCLRIQTFLSPSQVKRLLANWMDRYGLNSNLMGSRLGVRLLHVMSAWFIRQIRSIKSHISSYEDRRSVKSLTQSERLEIQDSLKSLVKEYSLIDRDFMNCLNNPPDGLHIRDQKLDCKNLIIEDMILKGPIDGRLIRSNYRFISFQDLNSIKLSLKKVFKIHSKILDLLMISSTLFQNDHKPPHPSEDEQAQEVESKSTINDIGDEFERKSKQSGRESQLVDVELLSSPHFLEFYGDKDEPEDLERFLSVIKDSRLSKQNGRFNSYFYDLISRFQASRSPDQPHSETRKGKSLNTSFINLIQSPQGRRRVDRSGRQTDSSDQSASSLRSSASNQGVDRHPRLTHSVICSWRSEHLNSIPIYFKSSSSS